MPLEFENASLLSYDYQNNFVADYFVLNSTKNITIKGYITSGLGIKDGVRVSAGNADASGIFETYSEMNEIINAGHDFWDDSIVVNGIDLGKGRVLSIDFVRDNPILFGEYEVSIEARESASFGDHSETETEYSPYRGVNFALHKHVGSYALSRFMNSFSDSYSLSVADNGAIDNNHDISIDLISGEGIEYILSTVREFASVIFSGDAWLQENNLFKDQWGLQDLLDTNDKISFYKEDIDLINYNFSFSKKFADLGPDKNYYSANLTHVFSKDEKGNITVNENGEVKGNKTPAFENAKDGVDTQIAGSYQRCQNILDSWGGGGATHDLKTKPTEIGRQYNSGAGTVSYNVNYTNNPRINTSYIHDYTQAISTDEAGITSVSENGNLRPYDSRPAIRDKNFDEPYLTGIRLYSGISGNANTRATTLYIQYLQDGRSVSDSQNNRSLMEGMSISAQSTNTLFINNGTSTLTLAGRFPTLVSRSLSFPGYGGAVTYSHSYSDDPTIIDRFGIKKMDISVSDTSPVIKQSPYLIPNKGEIIHVGGIPQTELGSRSVTVNAVKIRTPDGDLARWENLPNLSSEISFLMDNAYGKMIQIPTDVNLKINDGFINSMSYTISSEGELTLSMSAQYSAARSVNSLTRPYTSNEGNPFL